MWAQKGNGGGLEIEESIGEGRGEGSDRALLGCCRTNAANGELPKVPRPFALSTAELHEAPFHGSRRRHLPAPPRGLTGHQQGRAGVVTSGGGAGGQVGKPREVEGGRVLRCEASTELAGDQVRREEAEGEEARGSLPTLSEETFSWPARTPPRGGAIFPGGLGAGGGAGFVSILKTPARAAGPSLLRGARTWDARQTGDLYWVSSVRSPLRASSCLSVNLRCLLLFTLKRPLGWGGG